MEFIINLLLLKGKSLTKSAVRRLHETIQECLEFKRKILMDYERATRLITPFENMMESVNYNARHYTCEGESFIVTREVRCRLYEQLCKMNEHDNYDHEPMDEAEETSQKTNTKTNASSSMNQQVKPPNNPKRQKHKTNKDASLAKSAKINDYLVENLHAILKSQEFLFKNINKLITILEKDKANMHSEKLAEIKTKLNACTEILSNHNKSSVFPEAILNNIIEDEITRCRQNTGMDRSTHEMKTPSNVGLEVAVEAQKNIKKSEKSRRSKRIDQKYKDVERKEAEIRYKIKSTSKHKKLQEKASVAEASQVETAPKIKPEKESSDWLAQNASKFMSLQPEHRERCKVAFVNKRQFKKLENQLLKSSRENPEEVVGDSNKSKNAMVQIMETKLRFKLAQEAMNAQKEKPDAKQIDQNWISVNKKQLKKLEKELQDLNKKEEAKVQVEKVLPKKKGETLIQNFPGKKPFINKTTEKIAKPHRLRETVLSDLSIIKQRNSKVTSDEAPVSREKSKSIENLSSKPKNIDYRSKSNITLTIKKRNAMQEEKEAPKRRKSLDTIRKESKTSNNLKRIAKLVRRKSMEKMRKDKLAAHKKPVLENKKGRIFGTIKVRFQDQSTPPGVDKPDGKSNEQLLPTDLKKQDKESLKRRKVKEVIFPLKMRRIEKDRIKSARKIKSKDKMKKEVKRGKVVISSKSYTSPKDYQKAPTEIVPAKKEEKAEENTKFNEKLVFPIVNKAAPVKKDPDHNNNVILKEKVIFPFKTEDGANLVFPIKTKSKLKEENVLTYKIETEIEEKDLMFINKSHVFPFKSNVKVEEMEDSSKEAATLVFPIKAKAPNLKENVVSSELDEDIKEGQMFKRSQVFPFKSNINIDEETDISTQEAPTLVFPIKAKPKPPIFEEKEVLSKLEEEIKKEQMFKRSHFFPFKSNVNIDEETDDISPKEAATLVFPIRAKPKPPIFEENVLSSKLDEEIKEEEMFKMSQVFPFKSNINIDEETDMSTQEAPTLVFPLKAKPKPPIFEENEVQSTLGKQIKEEQMFKKSHVFPFKSNNNFNEGTDDISAKEAATQLFPNKTKNRPTEEATFAVIAKENVSYIKEGEMEEDEIMFKKSYVFPFNGDLKITKEQIDTEAPKLVFPTTTRSTPNQAENLSPSQMETEIEEEVLFGKSLVFPFQSNLINGEEFGSSSIKSPKLMCPTTTQNEAKEDPSIVEESVLPFQKDAAIDELRFINKSNVFPFKSKIQLNAEEIDTSKEATQLMPSTKSTIKPKEPIMFKENVVKSKMEAEIEEELGFERSQVFPFKSNIEFNEGQTDAPLKEPTALPIEASDADEDLLFNKSQVYPFKTRIILNGEEIDISTEKVLSLFRTKEQAIDDPNLNLKKPVASSAKLQSEPKVRVFKSISNKAQREQNTTAKEQKTTKEEKETDTMDQPKHSGHEILKQKLIYPLESIKQQKEKGIFKEKLYFSSENRDFEKEIIMPTSRDSMDHIKLKKQLRVYEKKEMEYFNRENSKSKEDENTSLTETNKDSTETKKIDRFPTARSWVKPEEKKVPSKQNLNKPSGETKKQENSTFDTDKIEQRVRQATMEINWKNKSTRTDESANESSQWKKKKQSLPNIKSAHKIKQQKTQKATSAPAAAKSKEKIKSDGDKSAKEDDDSKSGNTKFIDLRSKTKLPIGILHKESNKLVEQTMRDVILTPSSQDEKLLKINKQVFEDLENTLQTVKIFINKSNSMLLRPASATKEPSKKNMSTKQGVQEMAPTEQAKTEETIVSDKKEMNLTEENSVIKESVKKEIVKPKEYASTKNLMKQSIQTDTLKADENKGVQNEADVSTEPANKQGRLKSKPKKIVANVVINMETMKKQMEHIHAERGLQNKSHSKTTIQKPNKNFVFRKFPFKAITEIRRIEPNTKSSLTETTDTQTDTVTMKPTPSEPPKGVSNEEKPEPSQKKIQMMRTTKTAMKKKQVITIIPKLQKENALTETNSKAKTNLAEAKKIKEKSLADKDEGVEANPVEAVEQFKIEDAEKKVVEIMKQKMIAAAEKKDVEVAEKKIVEVGEETKVNTKCSLGSDSSRRVPSVYRKKKPCKIKLVNWAEEDVAKYVTILND